MHLRRIIIFIILATMQVYLPISIINVVSGKESINFVVHYIDVGQGDCTFIEFDDNTCMLIDCGEKSQSINNKIVSYIKNTGKTQIDYFVLTHPNTDHVGNAIGIANALSIKQVYIPDIAKPENFYTYSNILEVFSQKDIKVEKFSVGKVVKNEPFVAFLSPKPSGQEGSSFDELNLSDFPTEKQINNLSPIMYVEYKGARFLFTGDADQSQEQIVVNSYNVGLYDILYGKGRVKLKNIDFLKVGHHGGNDSSGQNFLDLIKAKNVVISVGGGNIYNHPDTLVLNRIFQANQNVNFYRTDMEGNIKVVVNNRGKYEVFTEL